MKIIEKEKITQEECKNYFINKKYELDKSLDGCIKGEYFEMCAKFFMECNNALPANIDNKISVKNIVGMEMLINEENDIEKIIYNSNNKISKMEVESQDKINKEIKFVEEILEKDNIENKIMLDEKYENKKNIDYYFVNQALKVKELHEIKIKKLNEKNNDNIKKEDSFLKNKRKRIDKINVKKPEIKKEFPKKNSKNVVSTKIGTKNKEQKKGELKKEIQKKKR